MIETLPEGRVWFVGQFPNLLKGELELPVVRHNLVCTVIGIAKREEETQDIRSLAVLWLVRLISDWCYNVIATGMEVD